MAARLDNPPAHIPNLDRATVAGFGDEWSTYDQSKLPDQEYSVRFDEYFAIFPFESLRANAEGFDMGCGSGRWAVGMAGRVGKLHCIDPSREALAVAKQRLAGARNVAFYVASTEDNPLPDHSQDFGYSLGVLHHVPDTRQALEDCVRKLKRGAPFLLYLYYKMENRPGWYRALWRGTDMVRRLVWRLPFRTRRGVTTAIAAIVYWPLARTASLAERLGLDPQHIPLGGYRDWSFYSMRTDSLDRFGTKLERRFTRSEIEQMMSAAGLVDIRFSERSPFWVACGTRGR